MFKEVLIFFKKEVTIFIPTPQVGVGICRWGLTFKVLGGGCLYRWGLIFLGGGPDPLPNYEFSIFIFRETLAIFRPKMAENKILGLKMAPVLRAIKIWKMCQ